VPPEVPDPRAAALGQGIVVAARESEYLGCEILQPRDVLGKPDRTVAAADVSYISCK